LHFQAFPGVYWTESLRVNCPFKIEESRFLPFEKNIVTGIQLIYLLNITIQQNYSKTFFKIHIIKIFFLPNPEDKPMVEQIFASQNDGEWEPETGYVTGVRPLLKTNLQADAVIARGVTGAAIARTLRGIPVVVLSVTGYDVMRAAHRRPQHSLHDPNATESRPSYWHPSSSFVWYRHSPPTTACLISG